MSKLRAGDLRNHMPFPTEADIREAKRMFGAGLGPEEILTAFRARGFTQVPSTVLLMKATGEPLNDSKRRVFNSATWSDMRDVWSTEIEAAVAAAAELDDEINRGE